MTENQRTTLLELFSSLAFVTPDHVKELEAFVSSASDEEIMDILTYLQKELEEYQKTEEELNQKLTDHAREIISTLQHDMRGVQKEMETEIQKSESGDAEKLLDNFES